MTPGAGSALSGDEHSHSPSGPHGDLRRAERRAESTSEQDFSDLRAMYINCTLKRSPELSHTEGIVDASAAIMMKHGVQVEVLRAVDHDIATGVQPDMTEHGWARDEWPRIMGDVLASDILVIAGRSGSGTTPVSPSASSSGSTRTRG